MEPIRLQGRTLSGDDVAAVGASVAQHPDWPRTALSLHLCELWDWRNGAGRRKDMAARTLLLKLERKGLIQLPPPRSQTHRPCSQALPSLQPELLPWAAVPTERKLSSLPPVQVELAHSVPLRRRAGQLLRQPLPSSGVAEGACSREECGVA